MRRNLWGAVAAIAATTACGGEDQPKSGILLGLDTQLTVPREVRRVGLYVEHTHDGRSEVVVSQETETTCDGDRCSVTFTATFAIQAGLDVNSNDRVRSRFVGFGANGAPIAMREARTAIPTDTVRQLRLPLLFINAGQVEDTTATGVTPSGDAVGLRAETSATPFERYRMIGCGPDQTLGDDGECTTIDLEIDSLPEGETFEKPLACFDAAACFGGDQGVRQLPVGADCTVQLPPSDAPEIAVGVRSDSGYATGNPDGSGVHPLDRELYTYDVSARQLSLRRAACAAAHGSVLVSVRCAAKPAAVPTCAPWQEVKSHAPPARPDASFADDPTPPMPDAGPDAVVDAGPDAEPPKDFVRSIPVDQTTVVKAFAARPDGKAWFLVDGDSGSSIRVAAAGRESGLAPDRIEHSLTDITGHFELGADRQRAYLLPVFSGSNAPFVVRERAAQAPGGLDPLRFAPCDQPAPPVGRITIGALNGQTIAVYGETPNDNSVAALLDANDPSCFVNPAPFSETQALEGFYRGSALGGRLRVPGGSTDYVFSFAPPDDSVLDLVPGIPYPPPTGSTVYLQSLIATSPQGGILTAKSQAASILDGIFYDVTLDAENRTVVGTVPRRFYPGEIVSREVFGAQGVICARFTYTGGTYSGVRCVRLGATAAADQEMDISKGDALGDIHVYGDADNLYLAKLCWEDDAAPRIAVVTKPWAQVDETSLVAALSSCSSPPPTPL